ncbi:hypothetical protein J6590_037230 [Homalodisca vitripennis]|nr:hypothetical protein J6590_037230 [Homalodisca vitripennis]
MDCDTAPSVSSLNTILSALAQKIDDISAKVDRLNDLPENVKLIQDDVKAIHDKFEQLEPRIERLEHRVSDIESRVDAKLADGSGFEKTLMEINDRNKRLCNVILYGIAKAPNQTLNLKENTTNSKLNSFRLKFTRRLTSNLLNSLELELIKVIFPNADQPRIFTKRFSDKYANGDGGVSMSRDRTVKERNHLRKLRADLEARKNAGENDLAIRYINGVPSISNHSVYDVIVLVETNLTRDISNVELGFFNYRVYRCNRTSPSSQKTKLNGAFPVWFSPELKAAIIRKKILHKRYKLLIIIFIINFVVFVNM